jgi:hypothetical protein
MDKTARDPLGVGGSGTPRNVTSVLVHAVRAIAHQLSLPELVIRLCNSAAHGRHQTEAAISNSATSGPTSRKFPTEAVIKLPFLPWQRKNGFG